MKFSPMPQWGYTCMYKMKSEFSGHACMLSCVWFFATPWTIAHQAPLSMEFSRQGHWSGLPFPSPGDLPDPWIELSYIGRQVLYCLSYQRNPYMCIYYIYICNISHGADAKMIEMIQQWGVPGIAFFSQFTEESMILGCWLVSTEASLGRILEETDGLDKVRNVEKIKLSQNSRASITHPR